MLSITSRPMEIGDFISMKKFKPFCDWRQVSKTINFGFIFGRQAESFAVSLEIDGGWTEKDCDDYIRLTNSQEQFDALCGRYLGRKTKKQIKFLLAATMMREAFFKTYKGFGGRIDRERKFAQERGYVRAWSGPVRLLPELKYMRFGKNGRPLGADKEMFSRMASHLNNNAVNSPIQTMEAHIAMATMIETQRWLEKWNLYSRCWNNVHDSVDAFVLDEEAELVGALISYCASYPREPIEGIPMMMDGEVSSATDEAYKEGKGQMYHFRGDEVDAIDLQKAIDNYNESHPNNQIGFPFLVI